MEVFGIGSKAVKVGEKEGIRELALPLICHSVKDAFFLVTNIHGDVVDYYDGDKALQDSFHDFSEKIDNVAVLLTCDKPVAEPQYAEHRSREVYDRLLWLLPPLWVLWPILSWLVFPSAEPAPTPTSIWMPVILLLLAAFGLFLCVMLHRQWTGEGHTVERVCSLFKNSNCSAAHDTFFFNKWFDLSEFGASYFLTVMILLLLAPDQATDAAWLLLPGLPFTLWSLGYQFLKQKTWCPLCVSVQLLLWIMAGVCLAFGAYDFATFHFVSWVGWLLLWGTLMATVQQIVTEGVFNRQKSEVFATQSSHLKVQHLDALLPKDASLPHTLTIAVSPTCPHCKRALSKIDDFLLPTGRFIVEKKYYPIHKGDEDLIANEIGREEAAQHEAWCKERQVNATPTVFVDGILLPKELIVEDLLYL